MLQIVTLQPSLQPQWGVMLDRLGPMLDRRVISESAACKGRKANWSWSYRSSATNTVLRVRRRMRKGGVTMANSSVDVEPTPVEVERLLVDGPEVTGSSSFNAKMNKASKWLVAVVAWAFVLWRHDEHTVWFMIGSIVSGGLAKTLKYLINEDRPSSAEGFREDPGMPSSHAQGFAYLATYACAALLCWKGINIWTSLSSLGVFLSFVYLSWLRVAEGLHTVPQVLVGSILGSAVAGFWLYLWKTSVGSAVDSSHSAKIVFYVSFLAACVVLYFISYKNFKLGQH